MSEPEPAPAASARPSALSRPPRLGLLLFLVALLAFLPAVKNGFVNYDDPEYVTANVHVKNGLTWDSVQWAFAAHGANWHPLTCLSHSLDGQLFGLRPWGHHLVSVLFHAANTALVFLVFLRLTGAKWRSFFVALLFGLHPLRVESVAWASERKDVLSLFFFLLTLLSYAKYISAKNLSGAESRLPYVLALVFFTLGLMSKSMLVTTPCLLLLLDFWPFSRAKTLGLPRLLLEKIPFVLLTVAFSVIAYFRQGHGAAMSTSLTLGVRFENAIVSYARYLGKIFWPANLSPLYPFSLHLPLASVLAAAALLAVISLFALALYRRHPALLIGWLWYLGTLVPVIGLIKIGEQSMADRYTYLPSLGIMLMLVWGVHALVKNSRNAAIAAATAALVAADVCLILTERQLTYWRNTETMFQRAVDTTQNNTLADVGLGVCLADRGQLEDAIRLYRHSLQVSPDYFESHNNLGLALAQQGKFDEAITHYRAALEQRSGVADTYINWGIALAGLHRTNDAIVEFQQAARLNPTDPLPHDNIARLLSSDPARLDEVIREFELAEKLQPGSAVRRSNLGALLMNAGRYDEAIAHLQAAIKLDPSNADAHNNLGTAFALKGRLNDAIPEFQAAVKLNPANPQAQKNLARALEMNRPAKP